MMTATGPSMTLTITREDAQRMLKASKALTESLDLLQKEQTETLVASNADVKATGTATSSTTETATETDADAGATLKSKASGSDDSDTAPVPTPVPTPTPVPHRVVSTSTSTSDNESVASVDADGREHAITTGTRTRTCTTGSSVSSVTALTAISSSRPLHALVVQAAEACKDEFIQEFVRVLKDQSLEHAEIQACLLIFIEADKNAKRRSAFEALAASAASSPSSNDHDQPANDDEKKADTQANSLRRQDLMKLFRCVLTSICLCIQENSKAPFLPQKVKVNGGDSDDQQPNKARKESEQSSPSSSAAKQATSDEAIAAADAAAASDTPVKAEEGTLPPALTSKSPSFDAMLEEPASLKRHLSESTMTEITEIATFASDHLYDNAHGKTVTADGAAEATNATISYATFESWYKDSGFSVVPWLELLDLAKWDRVGRGTGSADNSPSKEERKAAFKTEDIEMKPAAAVEKEKVKSPEVADSQQQHPTKSEPIATNFFMVDEEPSTPKPLIPASRTLVTFDFTGASSTEDGRLVNGHSPFCINITEENLVTLRNLVHRTGLSSRMPVDITKVLYVHSRKVKINGRMVDVLHKDEFGRCIRELVPAEAARTFSRVEMELFSTYFTNFFACYENSRDDFDTNVIDVKELSIGFSLLCAGNKSSKLSNGFELFDDLHQGFLSKAELTDYIRSYLTMLVGISLLSDNPERHDTISGARKKDMLEAVVNGATWTVGHVLKERKAGDTEQFTFESFARWYTYGGFNVASWVELIDLKKLLSLLPDSTPMLPLSTTRRDTGPSSAFRNSARHSASPRRRNAPGVFPSGPPQNEVLFTFPLAKDRSLVVLREDATYVRSVVERLGLLSLSPDDVWKGLSERIKDSPPPPPQPWSRSRHRKPGTGKSIDVDQQSFVRAMEDLMQTKGRNRNRTPSKNGTSTTAKDTVENFFQSFDLEQIDRVALNQLMGGLSLLCGGKKSTKLAFSFGLFDSRKETKSTLKNPSLNVDDMFVFLRSFLIVMFSCCRQSLDLSAESVSRYIADTSHMVAEDVMRFQWHTRNKDRVDFDEFGEWYNEGGFETAPWLELLDLCKWVLVDPVESHRPPPPNLAMKPRNDSGSNIGTDNDHYCPPPPPEDSVDPSFFADDGDAIMPMDSMDEMDLMLMQQPSHDKENDAILDTNRGSLILTPSPKDRNGNASNSLKFHLVSHEEHGGYMVSVSQKRVRHLRHILVESGLYRVDSEVACQKILSSATRKSKNTRFTLEKEDFDSAMRGIVASGQSKGDMSIDTQRDLSDLLAFIFSAFDRDKTGKVDAAELACGFTVLCNGKKSDKLEYAFDVLDVHHQAKLSRSEVSNYLRSFLTVLLCVTTSSHLSSNPAEDSVLFMTGKPCDRDSSSMARAADTGSEWASGQAFKGCYAGRTEQEFLNFDDFADWYTRKGYSCIPWLELLDLRKWVITEG
jgi:Ca2+-binding EF-hand superfamily protein